MRTARSASTPPSRVRNAFSRLASTASSLPAFAQPRSTRGSRAAIFEGVGTPWLTPRELGEMGYAHVSFPASLVFRIVGTMRETLAMLRRHAAGAEPMSPAEDSAQNRAALDDALGVAGWQAIESRGAPQA